MAHNISNHIKKLERLSLITCTNEVLPLLERALKNVEPIRSVDTKGVQPLLWQNELDPSRLHDDKPSIKLTGKDLKKNTSKMFEDYVVVGHMPDSGNKST